jgi:hypothetical protein
MSAMLTPVFTRSEADREARPERRIAGDGEMVATESPTCSRGYTCRR